MLWNITSEKTKPQRQRSHQCNAAVSVTTEKTGDAVGRNVAKLQLK